MDGDVSMVGRILDSPMCDGKPKESNFLCFPPTEHDQWPRSGVIIAEEAEDLK